MADLNMGSWTGRLTRDAERKTLPSGTELVVFDIANNTGWGDYKKTIYLTCNLWGKQGSGVFQYLNKGKAVGISGALEVQQWEDRDGGKHSKNVINCRDIILLADSRGKNEYGEGQSYSGNNPAEYEDRGGDDVTY
jgi:single-strand DNA-binding protein